jgi:eukaryotic-like serine/threonine-protein kinase
MDPERWTAVNQIFHAALELPPNGREEFVSTASEGDAELERDVIRLLKADSEAEKYLETPLVPTGHGLDSSPSPLEPGEIIKNRFRLERHVGQGGMGHVFEAFDLDLRVRVALKVIRPEIASASPVLEYFRREVRTARTITHNNVCRTYDLDRCSVAVGTQDSRELHFLTMEFLDGETLAARIRRDGPLPAAEAEAIARQIAAGLDSAHAAGVIHRDLKPANVMLVPAAGAEAVPRAVIMDFGLARHDPIVGGGSAISHSALVGTLAYMAPEQFDPGRLVSAETDVYAFGLILFEMVTGQRVYPSNSLLSGIAQRLSGAPPSPKVLAPGLSDSWERAIKSCLQPEPDDRVRSAGEAIGVLEDKAAAPPRRAKRLISIAIAPPVCGMRPRWAISALVVIASVSLFAVGLRLYHQSENSQVTPGALVYLAPIRNETGERALDGLTELLQAGLSQSVQINLLDQDRVGDTLQNMTKPPDTPITEPVAREIAMRTGAVRVVFPTVTGSKGAYTLRIDIQRPDNTPDRYREHWPNHFAWLTSSAAATAGTIPPELSSAIRNATDWVRFKCGESKNDIARLDVPPEDVTTKSWDALSDFAQAKRWALTGRRSDAVTALDRAVLIDPAFASAFASRGDILVSLRRETEGRQSYDNAIEAGLHNRLTRREEDRIHGMRATDSGDYEFAVDVFRDLSLNYPMDLSGWVYPSYSLRMLKRDDEAIADLRRAVSLAPDASFAPYALGQELLIEGRTSEAGSWVEYLRQHHHTENADDLESAILFLAHDYVGARRALSSVLTSTNPARRSSSYRYIADLDADTGDFRGAIADLDEGLRTDKEQGAREQYADKLLAKAYLECRLNQSDRCLEDVHEGFTLNPTLVNALAAEGALDLEIPSSSPSVTSKARSELLTILRHVTPVNFGRRSQQVQLRARGELQLLAGRLQDAVRTMTIASEKDAPAGGRTYLAHAMFALASSTGDKRATQDLLRRAQTAYAAVALHPALVRCNAGGGSPGDYGDQLQAYLHVSELLHDRTDTVKRAEAEFRTLRPSLTASTIQ